MNFTITLPSKFDYVQLEDSTSGYIVLYSAAKDNEGILVIHFTNDNFNLKPTYVQFTDDDSKMVDINNLPFLFEPINTLIESNRNKILKEIENAEAEENEIDKDDRSDRIYEAIKENQ